MEWLWENREWVFSGAGLVIGGWILKVVFFREKSTSSIKSGDNSINIQGSTNVKIKNGRKES